MAKKENLVIHMSDPSTDFLKPIYGNLPCDVVNADMPSRELNKLIKSHERVLMMGHGTSDGLLAGSHGFVINDEIVDVLKTKEGNVFIWCHADEFVKRNGLKGFSTGMFISEVGEADYCGVNATQKDIDRSNYLFSKLVKMKIESLNDKLLEHLKSAYIVPHNKVVEYNASRLYLF